MKKIKYLVLLCLMLLPITNVSASSASISCSSAGTVTVGNSITVTFTGNYSGDNGDMLMWKVDGINWSTNLSPNGFNSSIILSEDGDFSKSFTFTALNEGSATVQLVNVDVSDGDQLIGPGGASNSCSINVVAPAPSTNTSQSTQNSSSSSSNPNVEGKSSDNSLKSLSVEGADLIPKFDKDTLEYNVELSSDTTKIKVNADVNDSNASISGSGEIDVKTGQNKIQIVVSAENGATRTYIINAYVKEKNPIKVNFSGEEYILLRKLDGIDAPKNFKKKTIKFQKEEIEAYYNEKINCTLIALKNTIGDIDLYIYEKGLYSKYTTISSGDLELIIVKLDKGIELPKNYEKVKFLYNEMQVEGYSFNDDSDFRLIYAINVEDGKKDFYLYDMKQKTLQRYFNDQVDSYEDLVDKCKVAFILLGGFIIFLTIVIITLLSKNVKFKTTYLNARLSPIDNPKYNSKNIQYQDLEGTRMMNKVDVEPNKKKAKKAKNKKTDKKNKKTFLDE